MSDINESGVYFLLVDLAADVFVHSDHITQAHQHARTAYDTVLRLLPKVRPDPVQLRGMDEKLATLKRRLEAAGQRF